MQRTSGGLIEWLTPLAFIASAGWAIWHIPAFIIDLAPPEDESLRGQLTAIFVRNDVSPNLPGLFGGLADVIDWAALVLVPVIFLLGVLTVRRAPMEFEGWRALDRMAVFFGRVTMMLIVIMTGIMISLAIKTCVGFIPAINNSLRAAITVKKVIVAAVSMK